MSGESAPAAARAADHTARVTSQTVFDRPLVLEAGAGTGKTATLVARLVAWSLGPGWARAAEELRSHQAQAGRPEGVPADRVAARVLDGLAAVTFTEAAAAEMATRVAQALAEVERGRLPVGLLGETLAAAGGEERERAGALLVALDHLVVATIHAFCRRLLARVPLEAGLHPSFSVDAEGFVLAEVVQEVVESAFRQALRAPDGSALFALAAGGADPAHLTEALVALVEKGVPPGALAEEPSRAGAVAELAARVRARASEVRALLGTRLAASRRTPNATAIAAAAQALADLQPDSLADLLAGVAGVLPDKLVTHLEKWGRNEFGTNEADALGEATVSLRGAARELAGVVRHLASLEPERLDLARRALAPLLGEVHRAMRVRGAETFAALLRDARDVLARHPVVCARVRSEITQLMVDEFQDTDRRQCEILRLLALDGPPDERPGLFLIGDPKQSIYGWRDADLEAYDDFLGLVRQSGGEVMSLAVNFRSLPAILGEVERVVSPAMQREPGVQPAFQTLLPCDERAAEADPLGGTRAPVEHWVSWGRDGGGLAEPSAQQAAELEATALAADIRALHADGVPWRAFGVLMRSTGDIDVYLQALRDAGIPYLVERDRSYYRRREIIEAAALVRAVLDPGDHLALVTVLRSSVVGAPDAALIPLWARSFPDRVSALGAPGGDPLPALESAVLEVAGALPRDVPGIERVRGWERNLTAFLAHLVRLRASFETEPSAVFVERLRTLTLFEASEAARNLGRYRVANLDRFFRTLQGAIETDGDPHAVLRALRTAVGEAREAEEGRPLAAAEDAVRVMTIHKAKGLDFTHVYLVQAQKRSRSRARPIVDAEEIGGRLEYVLFGAATPGWHAVEGRRSRVGDAEMVRTLYVAMTRARDRLVVAGIWPSGSAPLAARPRSHMDLLAGREVPPGGLAAAAARAGSAASVHEDAAGARWVFPALAAREPDDRAPAGPAALVPAPEVERQAARLAGLGHGAGARGARAFSAPASEESHRALRELLAQRASMEESTPWRTALVPAGGGVATAVGAVVHGLLEELDLGGDLASQLVIAPEAIRGRFAGALDDAAAGDAVRRVEAILRTLTGGPLLARLRAIAPHVVARELAVLLPPEGESGPVAFVSGALDLVYRDPESTTLVIADYKTDDVRGESEVAERAATYASQGAAYRRALQEALALPAAPRFELWFLQAGVVREA